MTTKITGEATERSRMADANQTLLNFTDDTFLDQRSANDESVLVDEEELLFYFALYKITVPTAFGIIILVGLLGNLLVVCVTLSRHKMWTTVNLLLLNLIRLDIHLVTVPHAVIGGQSNNFSQLPNPFRDNLTAGRFRSRMCKPRVAESGGDRHHLRRCLCTVHGVSLRRR